jgi:predicted TIM-barrel fold metal-dependent hydrolase
MSTDPVADAVAALRLVDHHVHGALRAQPSADEFALLLTESDRLGPENTSTWDSQVGFAVRRWCAPLLGLPAFCAPQDYLARRRELGADAVNRTLLVASGIDHFVLETGFRAEAIHGVDGMRALSGVRVDEVVRLESLAEDLARAGVAASDFRTRFRECLSDATRSAVGLKSVVAYRFGLDFEPQPPSEVEVIDAAGAWLAEVASSGVARLTHPTLLRELIWAGIERELPIQFHVGYGDPDLDLRRCDPLHMTDFLKLVRGRHVPIMLLHTYPFHRNAGYLAQVFPDVYFDVGLGINYTGARSAAVIRESLELGPFGKVLFSSDAWGLAELHYLGARLWRTGMTKALTSFVAAGEWSATDAIRVADMMGAANARRVYGLSDS